MIKQIKAWIDRKKIADTERLAWEKCYNQTGLLKLAHSLEKGMGLPAVKHGYGKEKARSLLLGLENYASTNGNVDVFDYLESLHVLKTYVDYQRNEGILLDDMFNRVERLISSLDERTQGKFEKLKSGYSIVDVDVCEHSFDLYNYLYNRHSVRDYDLEQSITQEEIERAVLVAGLAPSACNRQPSKVYYTLDREKAKKVGEIIPGNRGYEEVVPYYAVITVDRSIFDPTEMFQWFVNGGIFTAYFVNGLYSQNIASCIFQFPFNDPIRSEKMRKIINASDKEAICAVVSFGRYKKKFKCLCAQRKSVVDLAKNF